MCFFFFVKAEVVFSFTCEGGNVCVTMCLILQQGLSQVLSPQNMEKTLRIKVIFKFHGFS